MPVVQPPPPFRRPKRDLVSVTLKRGYYVEPILTTGRIWQFANRDRALPPVPLKLAPSGAATRGPRSKYPCPFRSIFLLLLFPYLFRPRGTKLAEPFRPVPWLGWGYGQQRSAGFSESRQGRQQGVKWCAKPVPHNPPVKVSLSDLMGSLLAQFFFSLGGGVEGKRGG